MGCRFVVATVVEKFLKGEMMKNKSILNTPRRASRNFTIRRFNKGINSKLAQTVLPLDVAEFAYNFDFDSGVLRQGIGIAQSNLIDRQPIDGGVMSVWLYNKKAPEEQSFLMLASLSGQVYYRNLGKTDEFKKLDDIKLTSRPKAVVYRLYGEDVMIITTPTDGMYTWDGVRTVQKIESVPLITSMTIHFERMFVTTSDHPDAVWFSEDLDPTNFGTDLNEGGFIELIDERGQPLTALSYLNYIYVFREYGITRLTAFGGQEEFGASNLFVSSGRIYPRTVVLCGDSVVFLASDGMYMFDGMSTTRILDNLTNLIVPSPKATAVFANGKYYLALNMDFGDGLYGCERDLYDNNAMIVLDTSSGNYSVSRGFDVVDLNYLALYNQVLAVLKDGSVGMVSKNGSLYDQPLKKMWRVGMTDLDLPSRIKHVRQIDIHAKYDLELTFRTDKQVKTIKVKASGTISRIRLNMKCKLFGMDIVSYQPSVYISKPTLKVVSIGE